MADGKLIFESKIDNSNLKKDIVDIKKELKVLEEKKLKLGFVDLDKAKSELAELQEAMRELENMKLEGVYNDANMNYRADKQAIQELIEAKQQEVNKGLEYQAVVEREAFLREQLAIKTEELANNSRKSSEETSTLKRALELTSKGARAFSSAISSIFSKGNTIEGMIKKITHSFTSLFGLIKTRLKRLLVSSIINNIKNSFTELLSYNSRLSQSVSEMTSSFTSLGANIVGAVSPILELVVPIITQLVDWLNVGINALAKFFAMLTGRNTITKATKQQKDYSQAVSSSTKENDKLIASFDELNQLNESNSAGSSTGGAIEYIEESFTPWKDLLDAIESGDWQKVGELFAQKINEAVESIDFEGIGANIGQTIQKAVSFAFGFLSTIDTYAIGKGIMDMIATAIDNIDFNMLAQDLMLLVIRFFDFLGGLFDTSTGNDVKIGKAIADFINGGSEKLGDVGSSCGKAVGNFVKFLTEVIDTAISNIDWGQLFLNFLKGVVNFIGEVSQSVNDLIDEYLFGIPQEANEFQRKYQEVLKSGTEQEKAIYEAKIQYAEEHGLKAWEITDEQLQQQRLLYQQNAEETKAILEQQSQDELDIMTERGNADGTAYKEGFQQAIAEEMENGEEKADLISTPIQQKIDDGTYNEVGKQAISQVATGVNSPEEIKKIKAVFDGIITYLDTTFITAWTNSWNNIAIAFNGVWNQIISSVEKAVNSIADAINSIQFDVPEWVEGIGGKHFGLNVPHVSIPRLASGSVIPPNASQFLAILGDNNNDTEVVSPLETMKEALSEVITEQKGNQNITINFTGNLSQLARILKPELENEDKRIGKSLITG